MSRPAGRYEQKKESVRELVRRVRTGEEVDALKERNRAVIEGISPTEITQIEEELVAEGEPADEISKLRRIHFEIHREVIEAESELASPGHPINTLMNEHNIFLETASDLTDLTREAMSSGSFDAESSKRLDSIIESIKSSDSHFEREENVLFPMLEKQGILQPPAAMWSEHQQIRAAERELYEMVRGDGEGGVAAIDGTLLKWSNDYLQLLESHFYKENSVLFPTALEVIPEEDWTDASVEFDKIGYCCFTPQGSRAVPVVGSGSARIEGKIEFDTGTLTLEQLAGIFTTLPVEMTFIDADDTVRFFSETSEKIFIRSKASLGRKVQQCHPQKSVDRVNKIIDEFKGGMRDVADFWITMGERTLYIRYFPVRNPGGVYLGCLEAVQDITDVRKLTGEKRLP